MSGRVKVNFSAFFILNNHPLLNGQSRVHGVCTVSFSLVIQADQDSGSIDVHNLFYTSQSTFRINRVQYVLIQTVLDPSFVAAFRCSLFCIISMVY